MDFMHILGQQEAIWNTIFSIFERRRDVAPKRRGVRENFPLYPISTGLQKSTPCIFQGRPSMDPIVLFPVGPNSIEM